MIQSNTCEQYCTLLSRLYPDWVTCATTIPVNNSVSVLLGVTAGGTLKVWRISSVIKDSVIFEEESKQIRECSHPIQVQIKLTFLVILTRKSLLVIDSSDFMTVGIFENRNRSFTVYTSIIFITKIAITIDLITSVGDIYEKFEFVSEHLFIVITDSGRIQSFSISHLSRNSQTQLPESIHHINLSNPVSISKFNENIYLLEPDGQISTLNCSKSNSTLSPIQISSISNRELDIIG